MTALAELTPRIVPHGDATFSLIFLCPKCRKHEIGVDCWPFEAKFYEGRNVWHWTPDTDFTNLSLTPSINREGLDKCGGWHGFVTNGETAP
jgi:hypothetical protein